ncbi:DNA alkylation repair protein [Paenibacillus sp. ACRRX]|uniref:DNA alkylation repair protein n=1 Tax=unclassified Paenibacillus TaxID=185978 RepID=UPI001EF41C04|nr:MULTISPECIES: DNA alkylation repair protein [unclassified Paenibacillus]MCG7408634.1 DNA alkylation repair protein [Paenibacillus sp. ACRRX]MDK8182879.1 DNA alkylation repair protein [Paenibacillus sp. UMB4589-SE434]
MSHYPIEPIVQAMKANADPEKAAAMSKYMRGQFPFFGIPQPKRKELFRSHIRTYGKPASADVLLAAVEVLWAYEERELAYVAMELLEGGLKLLELSHIHRIERCILTKSWWDTVDGLASHTVGGVMSRYSDDCRHYAGRWIGSDQMWLNRTALLFQLKYKGKTDRELLAAAIAAHVESKEFFIQKAIGWALREYAKTDPGWVAHYVEQHELMPLSRREAVKGLMLEGV